MSRSLFFIAFVMSVLPIGCSTYHSLSVDSVQPCLERLERRLNAAPVQTHLSALDGQKVPLEEFFERCLNNMPYCSLPEKFYHWKTEVRSVVSQTPDGKVAHRIRIYHNYLSTCDPSSIDSQKTHGDIAEFYDGKGEFMGLAVYVGDGLYVPLPYSKYFGGGKQLKSL